MNNNTPRTRAAINILNRLNQGHDLATVLGMDIELALYQIDATLKVNPLIQPLREEFAFRESAQNILNGKAMLDHLQTIKSIEYPFGKNNLPPADDRQKQAISQQMNEVIARLDTACELLDSETLEYKKNLANFKQYVEAFKKNKTTENSEPEASKE